MITHSTRNRRIHQIYPPTAGAAASAVLAIGEEDLLQLEVFKVWLPKGRGGVMGEVSARYWGERGERARKNKLYNTEK